MPEQNYTPAPARRTGGGRGALLAIALAFAIGAALVGWLAWRGLLPIAKSDRYASAPSTSAGELPTPAAGAGPVAGSASSTPALVPATLPPVVASAVESRVAGLEQRIARLDLQAQAASGNAARAEGLLIAFAARRALERGAPLGYLEDQLRLRFADAQPNAVDTIIAASRAPVTRDQLSAQLEGLAATLKSAPAQESGWAQVRREFSSLFVVRRSNAPSPDPLARFDRARLFVSEGQIDAAIAEVQHLPGASGASTWIGAARRYETAQRALDLLETTAVLEPRRLTDGSGKQVDQPSPVAPAGATPAVN